MIIKRCIRLAIVYNNIHLIDLQILIISLEIDNAQTFLAEFRARKLQERGIINVEHMSGTEANKFL